jgi:hypothetical protein
MHRFDGGNSKIEHEQRHRDGENAVAQRCQALDALTRDAIVKGRHCQQFTSTVPAFLAWQVAEKWPRFVSERLSCLSHRCRRSAR